MCAPKGAGFLHVAPHWQERVGGPIVSWGERENTFRSRTEMQGTNDPAAYLAVPAAIEYVQEHDDVARCVALARATRRGVHELLEVEPAWPEHMVLRMASFPVPNAPEMQRHLWDEHRIEIPSWPTGTMRASVAMYTTEEDVERLLDALPAALRTSRSPA